MSVEVELFGDFDIRGVSLRVTAAFGGEATVFEARLGDLSLGAVIEYVVGLAAPSLEVKLPPPWNVLHGVNLRDLVLRMDVTHGTVGVVYEKIDLDLGFLQVDALALTYSPGGSSEAASVDLKLFGRLLDRRYPYPHTPLSWDLLSEPPPNVPSAENPAFELDYLGFGQRVTLRDPARLGAMATVIEALQQAGGVPDSPDPLREISTLRFDATAGWLIGASFTVLGTLRLMAVFNDPALYGLRVELSGERARKLAGLEFEILYRKVGPGLGVYHLELELPEAMRHLEMGAVSVTLPYFVLDVWTNGNFMVNLGFPQGLDFSRSFTLQTFVGPVPVIGAGGFYFGSLSAETSTAVPRITNGRFAPVLAFGIGLQIGIGRTIEMGMLRAGIVIALEGVLEGVVAFFEPQDSGVGSDVWYRVHGTVALVGHIYGEIDFAIVKARVDLYAYASASVTLEAYAATVVVLEAGVTAELKVKVAFFHVHLSFRAKVRQSMTLGRAGQTPWRVEAPPPPMLLTGPGVGGRRVTGSTAAVDRTWLASIESPGAGGTPGLIDTSRQHVVPGSGSRDPRRLLMGAASGERLWAGARVVHEVRTLDVYFQPMATVGSSDDRPGAAAGAGHPEVQLVALLFMPLGGTASGAAGFEDLAWAALQWALAGVRAGTHAVGQDPDAIDRGALAGAFHDLVASGDPERVSQCDIVDFLRENFHFRIRAFPDDATARAALRDNGLTLFPPPPYLTLQAELAGHEANLQELNRCTPEYRAMVDAYFRRLHPDGELGRNPGGAAAPGPGAGERHGGPGASGGSEGPPPSLPAFIFADAARLVLRGVLRAGLDAFEGWEASPSPEERLTDILARYGVAGADPMDELALANQERTGFWATGAALTLTDLRTRVREGESPRALATRTGVELEALAEAAAATPDLLAVGATIHVEGGRTTTLAGETVREVAARLATTVESLLAVNPELPWPPAPDGQERLPEGLPIVVPVVALTIGRADSLDRVAARFGVSAGSLLTLPGNADADDLLTPGIAVPLPPVVHAVAETDTPASLAGRFGVGVCELVAQADSAGAVYGRLSVPGCTRLPAADLHAALRADGAFSAVAGSLARFLLGGLRLPDPDTSVRAHRLGSEEAPDWRGIPLHPLYVLTGQQWPFPSGDPAAERVTLRRNSIDDDEPCQRPLITFHSDTPDEALTVGIGAEEVATVTAYRALAEKAEPVDPQLLAVTRGAPFITVPRRFPVGVGIVWHAVEPPDLGPGPGPGQGSGGDPMIFPLSLALAETLRAIPQRDNDIRLIVRPTSAHGSASAAPREIQARGWATRIEVEIRRARDPGNASADLPSVVEVFSSDGPGRARLLELVEYLRAHVGAVPRIHLLRPSNPTGSGGPALRSDAVDPSRVLLLKTNLSTWTRPPTGGLLLMAAETGEPPVHASLGEPLPFLELLWEACVVGAGGFHLVYPAGDGGTLPDGLFQEGDTARLTALVLISPDAESGRTVAAEPFHDCVVTAEPLSEGMPFVEPPLFTVSADTGLNALAEALQVDPRELALANGSTDGLIAAGSALTLPGGGKYQVQAGDDLLDIILMVPAAASDEVVAAVGAAGAVIHAGTRGWTHPDWVTFRPTLAPGRVAFRVVRTDPDPEAATPAKGSGQDDPPTRLRTLYNLLDARIDEHGPFQESAWSLPIAPARHDAPEALNPVAEGAQRPWRYDRVLGLQGSTGAAPDAGGADRYLGLGEAAAITLRLLDVFGNHCLSGDAVPRVEVPIRYTDALVGPGQWPGVSVVYRFAKGAGPRLELRASLDAGRTTPTPGAPFSPLRERASADRAAFAVVRRQLEQADLQINVASSMDSRAQTLEREGFVRFTRSVDRWLATVEALREGSDRVRPGDTAASIAERWRIPLDVLAAANRDSAGFVAAGAGSLIVPRLHVFARRDTLDLIVQAVGIGGLTSSGLARLNAQVPLVGGAAVVVAGRTIPVVAGATLASLAGNAGVEVEALGEANADVPDLFSPGTRLLVDVHRVDVEPGCTLAALAAEFGIGAADLLAANAASSSLLAEGATVVIPDHLQIGGERAATTKVRAGESLSTLARRLGVEVLPLVQANLAVDGILATKGVETVLEAVSSVGVRASTVVEEGDTLATALHRLRVIPGCVDVDAAAVARANADRKGLLTPGAIVLVPPGAWTEAVPLAPDYSEVIFPLRAWIDLARSDERVDPVLPADSPVRSLRCHLSPALGAESAGAGDTRALEGFARDFIGAFPELQLATASGQHDDRGAVTLFAVQVQNSTVSWKVGPQPQFFAPQPLMVTPWSTPAGQPVAVRPYADGKLGDIAPQAYQGIDLDVWGREVLEAVDRFLGADHSVTAQRLCAEADDDAYARVVRAKAALAAALRDSVRPVLEVDIGDPAADPAAAREALYQRVLTELSEAYRIDSVVQLPVTVKSPFPDRAVAPRLYGRVMGSTLLVQDESTLGSIADHFGAPAELVARLLSRAGALLLEGEEIEMDGRAHRVGPGDTIASVAEALGVEPGAVGTAIADRPGLLRPDAPIDLVARRHAIRGEDTLGTVLERLAEGSATVEAISTFAVLNGDLPALLRTDASVTVDATLIREGDTLRSIAGVLATTAGELARVNAERRGVLRSGTMIEADGASWEVRDSDTLQQVAGALGVPLNRLVGLVRERPDLLRAGALLRRVDPLGDTVSGAGRLSELAESVGASMEDLIACHLGTTGILREGTEARWLARRPAVTLSEVKVPLAEGATLTFLARVSGAAGLRRVALDPELHITAIEYDVRSVPWAGAYQASEWLTLVEPLRVPLRRMDVPVPLRMHPHPPMIVSHRVLQHEPESPGFEALRRYDYELTYTYDPAAQDELFFDTEVNVPEDLVRGPSAPDDESLPYLLARYDAIAGPLWRDLGRLRDGARLLADPQGRRTVFGAIEVFADLIEGIGSAWGAWQPPVADPLVTGRSGRAPGGRAAEGTRRVERGEGAEGAEQLFVEDARDLDALRTQNIRGRVRVTRNAALLQGRKTDPAFVYEVPPIGPSARLWPLVRHMDPIRLSPAPRALLLDRLSELFAGVLGITPASPDDEARPLQVAVSWSYALSRGDGAGANGTRPALDVVVPVTFSAPSPFVPGRDLNGADGLCARLAARLTRWLEEASASSGEFRLAITAYSNLGAGAASAVASRPLLELPDVRLPIS